MLAVVEAEVFVSKYYAEEHMKVLHSVIGESELSVTCEYGNGAIRMDIWEVVNGSIILDVLCIRGCKSQCLCKLESMTDNPDDVPVTLSTPTHSYDIKVRKSLHNDIAEFIKNNIEK